MERRQNRFNREHTTQLTLKLNRKTDADVIERLSKVASKRGYILSLIRADIAKSES